MSHADTQARQAPTEARVQKAKKATGAAVFGTFVEYYDFSVYGYVAATLAVVFFPSEDPAIGLLNTLLVFGSAFLVRPLGAVAFGWLGDRIGRRTSLIACITLMGLSATLIGLLPGYAQIGVWAPILLVVLRMLQGFSAGGEIGGAAAYIREWAAPEKRSLYISFIPSIAVFGKGLAAGIAALTAAYFSGPEMESWGWRIPFLLALPLGIIGLMMRLSIEDSPEFAKTQQDDKTAQRPFGELMRDYRGPLSKVVLIALVQNIGTYIGTVFIAVYMSNVLGFTKAQASTIVLFAILLAAVLIPFAGQLGSRIGGKRLLLTSYIAYVILTLPSFLLMQQGSVGIAIVGLMIGMIPYALCQAGTYGTMPEFFPVRIRHTGVAFGHSMGAVLGGGAGPYLATWLIARTDNIMVPAYMMIIAGVIGILILLTVQRNAVIPGDTDNHQFR